MEEPAAHAGGLWARDLVELSADVGVLDRAGRWFVAIPYDGEPVLARFASWSAEPVPTTGRWHGPPADAWTSSMDEAGYRASVAAVRERIAAGDVYQANICRVLAAPLPDRGAADVLALGRLLERGNPAPYAAQLRIPGLSIACASPELFLRVTTSPTGERIVTSGPIKGTGRTARDLTAKDQAENIMIVDLVRNDLSIVARTGSVDVPRLLAVEEHPGLVHLVSDVQARLRDDVRWHDLLSATFPPGSVTGAPKLAALELIADLEPASRGYYCGAVGWVDADRGTAELAVSIRTFWHDDDILRFGTGAGITWGSDPRDEWDETRLKATRLIGLAGQRA